MSPYFPPQQAPKPYWCPNCHAWFEPANVSCLVLHPPGSCCHEHERRVAAAEAQRDG